LYCRWDVRNYDYGGGGGDGVNVVMVLVVVVVAIVVMVVMVVTMMRVVLCVTSPSNSSLFRSKYACLEPWRKGVLKYAHIH
jgi:uncharacterized membrane protein